MVPNMTRGSFVCEGVDRNETYRAGVLLGLIPCRPLEWEKCERFLKQWSRVFCWIGVGIECLSPLSCRLITAEAILEA